MKDERHDSPATTTRRRRGFTLIEVMVVVAILGILASIALPNLWRYVHKARRSEALTVLKTLNQLQIAYYGREGEFSDSFLELGFDLEHGEMVDESTIRGDYYTYTVETRPLDGNAAGNYRVTATGDIDPSDSMLDVIIIENRLTVNN